MRTALLCLVAAAAAACADGAIDPVRPDVAAQNGPRTPDATGQAAQPSDTTRPANYPSSVRVRGHVLTTVWTAGRTVGDTLTGFTPVAGARVTLYRNVLVDGRGVSQLVGERTTGADGSFVFEGAPGGPYVLALNVTPERPYGDVLTYVMGDRAEVTADLRIWTRASASADSAGGGA
jgi:hypothetical protein